MLKYGFTTGSCAAAAAKAAAIMAMTKEKIEHITIYTPKGYRFETKLFNTDIFDIGAVCAVKKFSGDDPDVTNGILIFADVRLTDDDIIEVDCGYGIGRVTKPGLQIQVGKAAINSVPMQMIENEVRNVFKMYDYLGGAKITISAPEGKEIAERTFNPKLGIVGGISILGTSGIVEPMSEKALIDTIEVEMNVKKAENPNILIMTPGNYGADFLSRYYGIDIDRAVKCSNFIGASVDMAVKAGFKKILFIGHIGKLVKVAGGIMDTHSKNADCRMEIMTTAALKFTEDIKLLRTVAECSTTDVAIEILKSNGLLEPVMSEITKKIMFYLNKRADNKTEIGVIVFSNEFGVLGKSENAEGILEEAKGVLA